MATGLRVEDRLDGAVNFYSWKERMSYGTLLRTPQQTQYICLHILLF
jgi:hypothetical protein